MFNHDLLEIKKLERKTSDTGRVYVTDEGNSYPSVTTVLGQLNKDAILEWRKRVGEQEATAITTRASNRGTAVHNILENFVLNKTDYLHKQMPHNIAMFKTIEPFLVENVSNILGIEIPLYSNELKAAGTADLLCVYNNTPTILDFKTSRKPKREEWIDNYKLQCTTYALMVEEMYNIIIPQYCILIGNDEGFCQEFLGSTLDLRERVIEIFEEYHK